MAYRGHVLLCGGTGCVSGGSMKLRENIVSALESRGLEKEYLVLTTGCHGMCEAGPIVVVYPEGTFYTRVAPEDAREIVDEHLLKGRTVARLLQSRIITGCCPLRRADRASGTQAGAGWSSFSPRHGWTIASSTGSRTVGHPLAASSLASVTG